MTDALRWPRQPLRKTHCILGKLRRWNAKGKQYRVDQYVEGTGYYIAQVRMLDRWELISSHPRSRRAAMKACEQHARRHA